MRMRIGWVTLAAGLICTVVGGIGGCYPGSSFEEEQAYDLLAPGQMGLWRPTPGYSDAPPWTLSDGAFEGHGSWVGHASEFGDFALECEFLYRGEGQGGIVIRGDRLSPEPWESGYELDIDGTGEPAQGHVHFPVFPKPYAGDAVFEAGRWQSLRIEAFGPTVTVRLNGVEVLSFVDRRFSRGHICLEGEPGGVLYRNLRVRPLP